jgi:LysR family carnitine catabolism transcriptional activator
VGQQTLQNLTERQLQAVLALATCRNFTVAAAQLGMSQPALTRTIVLVEAMMGAPAFDRTTRSVRLTPVGRELASAAGRITDDLRRTRIRVQDLTATGNRQIVISALPSSAATVIATATASFLATHPDVEVVVRDNAHDRIVEDVAAGNSDFGIAYLGDLPPTVQGETLAREHFALVVHPHHGLADRPGVTLEEIAAFPLVSLPPDAKMRRMIDVAAEDRGIRLRYVATACTFSTGFAFVKAGVGAMIAPLRAVEVFGSPAHRAIPIPAADLAYDVGLIRPAEGVLPSLAEAFVREIRFACQRGSVSAKSNNDAGDTANQPLVFKAKGQ